MLTEFVKERLAQLLAENVPRRARTADTPVRPTTAPGGPDRTGRHAAMSGGQVFPTSKAVEGSNDPPEFLPSDDEEGDDWSRPRPASSELNGRRAPSVDNDEDWAHRQAPVLTGMGRRSADPSSDDPRPRNAELQTEEIDDWRAVPPQRSFGRAHVGVVVGLLLVGLLCAGWAVLRARPIAIAGTPVMRSTAAPATAAGDKPAPKPSATATPAAQIMVHVLGAVKKPGVVTLPERSRVRDAIAAAGGLQREAAPRDLNLAQVLSDGEQVVIGTRKRPAGEVRDGPGTTQPGGTDPASGGAGEVNLNTATQSQLEELPGVGPVTAGKILAWRQEHGRFSRVAELQEIDGIGPKTFAQIAPHTRV